MGDKHNHHGHGNEKTTAHEAEKPKFERTKALADNGFTTFVDAYVAAQGLDSIVVHADNHRLEAIWKLYKMKQETAKELTDFYNEVLLSDVGMNVKDHPEFKQTLAEVDAYVTQVACEQTPDLKERYNQINDILKMPISEQAKKIKEYGFSGRYLFSDGTINSSKLEMDRAAFAESAGQITVLERSNKSKAFLNRSLSEQGEWGMDSDEDDHHGGHGHGKKEKKPEVVEHYKQEKIPQFGFEGLLKMRHDIEVFKKHQLELKTNKPKFAEQIKLSSGGEKDPEKVVEKARNHFQNLEKIAAAKGRSEKMKLIEQFGLEDRYVREPINFEFRNQVKEAELEHDIAELRAALADLDEDPRLYPESKKFALLKIKEDFLNLKLASGTVLETAQAALRRSVEGMVSDQSAVEKEEEEVEMLEKEFTDNEEVIKKAKNQAYERLKNEEAAYEKRSEALEKLKLQIEALKNAGVPKVEKKIDEIRAIIKKESDKIAVLKKESEVAEADLQEIIAQKAVFEEEIKKKEVDYIERDSVLQKSVQDIKTAPAKTRAELRIFIDEEGRRLFQEKQMILHLQDEVALFQVRLKTKQRSFDSLVNKFQENKQAWLNEYVSLKKKEKELQDERDAKEESVKDVAVTPEKIGEVDYKNVPFVDKEAYLAEQVGLLAVEKKAITLFANELKKIEVEIESKREAVAGRRKSVKSRLETGAKAAALYEKSRNSVTAYSGKVVEDRGLPFEARRAIDRLTERRKEAITRQVNEIIKQLAGETASYESAKKALDAMELTSSERKKVVLDILKKALNTPSQKVKVIEIVQKLIKEMN